MFSNLFAMLTATGKIIISIEAVFVAVLLAVLIIMCVKIMRDKKRGNFDFDAENSENDDETKVLSEDSAIDVDEAADVEKGAAVKAHSDIDSIAADIAPEIDVKAEIATVSPKYDLIDLGMSVTPEIDEVFKNRLESDALDDDTEEYDGKIVFMSKMATTCVENKAIYNALKNEILSYRNIKSRVTNGGDYFRIPGRQIIKIVLIGKTLRLAIALNPADYDYNIFHQKDRSGMKKYEDTPMFVKVQSKLGVQRAFKLIEDCMTLYGVKKSKKYEPLDFARILAVEFEQKSSS